MIPDAAVEALSNKRRVIRKKKRRKKSAPGRKRGEPVRKCAQTTRRGSEKHGGCRRADGIAPEIEGSRDEEATAAVAIVGRDRGKRGVIGYVRLNSADTDE